MISHTRTFDINAMAARIRSNREDTRAMRPTREIGQSGIA